MEVRARRLDGTGTSRIELDGRQARGGPAVGLRPRKDGWVDDDELLAALRVEAADLAVCVASADLATEAPTCPDWTVGISR